MQRRPQIGNKKKWKSQHFAISFVPSLRAVGDLEGPRRARDLEMPRSSTRRCLGRNFLAGPRAGGVSLMRDTGLRVSAGVLQATSPMRQRGSTPWNGRSWKAPRRWHRPATAAEGGDCSLGASRLRRGRSPDGKTPLPRLAGTLA